LACEKRQSAAEIRFRFLRSKVDADQSPRA
jgi:hypothetical protein